MIMNKDILRDAFRKLLSYTYFDKSDLKLRRNIAEFAKSLNDSNNEERIFNELLEVANGKREDLLQKWLSNAELNFYPKKIKSSVVQQDSHFVTNIPEGHSVTERILIRSYFPVEIMILDTAWTLEYGPIIDGSLKHNTYGNRLDLTLLGDKVRFGNSIFKKYINQYQSWWKEGLRTANQLLKEGNNVSIVNFDITDCYHSIDFDFRILFNDIILINSNTDILNNPLTNVIINVYEKYWSLIGKSDAQPFMHRNQGKHSMPLSLLSTHVLANWYIAKLDEYITESYSNISYYGRYVDDCMIVMQSKPDTRNAIEHINELLPGFIKRHEDTFVFNIPKTTTINGIDRLSNFCIQTEKLYVYHFDCQLPQESLEKFEDEQRERSSEFRFLTDDIDHENGQGLEFATLVQSFDVQEAKSKRFNILEENKYKLSVFFAKLNQKLAKYGTNYEKITEVDKVYKYFHGYLLIKHYTLWEKMFTAFVLSERNDYIDEFYKRILLEIESVDAVNELFINDKPIGLNNIKESLKIHLQEAYCMAKSLHKQDAKINTIYIDTFMVRAHFNLLPMQEFANDYSEKGVKLPFTELEYDDSKLSYRWMPYYVKYYDIVCAQMIGKEFDPKVYKEAYHIYKSLNKEVLSEDEWKVFMHKGRNEYEWEFNTSFFELPPRKLTVSIVEMLLTEENSLELIKNYGEIDYNKLNLMQLILDRITAVKNTDIFIMPELALPVYELREFCQYSAKYQKAFITGLEYVVKDKNVSNYIVTCLPIVLYGQNDAVPIIRLKNYYAPAEYKEIEDKMKYKIKESSKKWKMLYHWKGHVFTNYYCYELTSIKDRSHFISFLDAIYCPVLNKDTRYFDNISESCSRDLHCYFIMSNTSKYGDSRVTQPTKSVEMNILKVKGGNTEHNNVIVLSAEIEIKKLREFQKKSLKEQRECKDYKCTPPDFEKANIDKRRRRFILETDTEDIFDVDFWDDFIANMYLTRMRPII